jgi:hypothetical protein
MLRALKRTLDPRPAPLQTPDVRVERCLNRYARAFAPATGGEQFYLQYRNRSWHVVTSGTGLACADADAGRGLLRACTALRYPTTAEPERITSPQVAADRLVRAWMRHDTIAAMQLTRDDAPIEVLFGEHAPTSSPEPIPCRPVGPGRFLCSYPLAPRAELSITAAGGASAGYEITGVEFGD